MFGGFGGGNQVRVNIVGDASKLKGEMKEAQGSVEQFESKSKKRLEGFSRAIKAALIVGAGVAVSRFATDSVRAFSDLNESVNAVEVTFGDAADSILEIGESAATTRGMSNAAFNSMAVQFSAFAQTIAGESGRDVAEIIDDLSTRIADFASVMNLDMEEATLKFQSGLAGETEPLRKFGIDVSAARVEAFAFENGIAQAGDTLTEQQKVLARYGTIMEQTGKTAGDFANTSEDLANKQRILKAEVEDAQAQLGEAMVPAMLAVLGATQDFIPWLTRLFQGFAEATGAISMAELALSRVETQMNVSRGSAEAMGFAIGEIARDNEILGIELFNTEKSTRLFRQSLMDLMEASQPTREELQKLIDGLPFLIDHLELSDDEAEILAETLQTRLASALTDAEMRAREALTPALGELEDQADDTTEAVDDTSEALLSQVDAMDAVVEANKRSTDPFLQVLEAQRKLKTAQDEYNKALDEFGPGSEEAVDAAGNLISANQTLDEALAKIAREAGPNWREEFRRVASDAGVAKEEIDLMIAAVDRANGASAIIDIGVNMSDADRALLIQAQRTGGGGGSSSGSGSGGGSGGSSGGGSTSGSPTTVSHTGGRVNAPLGQEVDAKLLGGETVIPAGGGGHGGGTTINYFAGTQIGNDRVLRELQELARRR